MVSRPLFARKRTVRPRRKVRGCFSGIKLDRSDVGEVVFLHRRGNLETDLTIRATYELALNQTSILQLQGIGKSDRSHQAHYNDQSTTQLEFHHQFSLLDLFWYRKRRSIASVMIAQQVIGFFVADHMFSLRVKTQRPAQAV